MGTEARSLCTLHIIFSLQKTNINQKSYFRGSAIKSSQRLATMIIKKIIIYHLLVVTSGAFQINPTSQPRRIASLESRVEEHLQELKNEWETLEEQVKEFAKAPNSDKVRIFYYYYTIASAS